MPRAANYKFGGGTPARNVEAKTANYTITADDHGKIFTNRGAAGAVNFTLPAPAEATAGMEVTVFVIADQNVTITSGTADTLIAFNDAAADSVAFSTAGERIGNGIRCICDGTSWLALVSLGDVAVTGLTIAT